MKVLVCTDGTRGSERTAAFASGLHLVQGSEVTLLWVQDGGESAGDSRTYLDRVESQLFEPASLSTVSRNGDFAREITLEAERTAYDLVIVPRHPPRHLPPIVSQPDTHMLARRIASHLLLVRNPPEEAARRILVCSSGEGPSNQTLAAAGRLIHRAPAEVNLIHVMSQVSLRRDSPVAELEESAGEAMQAHTLEGHRFEEGIEILSKTGVRTPIRPVLRHGLVVDEVLAEVEEGGYDLVVLGSHYQPGLTRWMDVLLDDVASALLDHLPCSVLIIGPGGAEDGEAGLSGAAAA